MLRLLPLALLSRRRLGEAFGARAARMYGVGIALSYTLLVLVLPGATQASTFNGLLKSALTSASWAVAGFVSLSAARDLSLRDDNDGVSTLASSRGYAARDLAVSRLMAAAWVIAIWIILPLGALSVIAGLRLSGPNPAAWALAWLLFIVLYAPLLGITVSALCRVAARLYPKYGRGALAAFVLVPHLLRWSFPSIPSVPAAFGWLLSRGATLVSGIS